MQEQLETGRTACICMLGTSAQSSVEAVLTLLDTVYLPVPVPHHHIVVPEVLFILVMVFLGGFNGSVSKQAGFCSDNAHLLLIVWLLQM